MAVCLTCQQAGARSAPCHFRAPQSMQALTQGQVGLLPVGSPRTDQDRVVHDWLSGAGHDMVEVTAAGCTLSDSICAHPTVLDMLLVHGRGKLHVQPALQAGWLQRPPAPQLRNCLQQREAPPLRTRPHCRRCSCSVLSSRPARAQSRCDCLGPPCTAAGVLGCRCQLATNAVRGNMQQDWPLLAAPRDA